MAFNKNSFLENSSKFELGMVHGRFQPFHKGHLEYVTAALNYCQKLVIAFTNPDKTLTKQELLAPHRHLKEANPFTLLERVTFIQETLIDDNIPLERIIFISFPINLPDLWEYYITKEVVQFIRIASPWEEEKAERFRRWGSVVKVLDSSNFKYSNLSATQVRKKIFEKSDWTDLVPHCVAMNIQELIKKDSGRFSK